MGKAKPYDGLDDESALRTIGWDAARRGIQNLFALWRLGIKPAAGR
jgi:hypothetical protein